MCSSRFDYKNKVEEYQQQSMKAILKQSHPLLIIDTVSQLFKYQKIPLVLSFYEKRGVRH